MKIDRFKKFLLNEKVSAMDWKDAMNDPNILIGLEFEYFDNNLKDYTRDLISYSVSDIDFLMQDYDNLIDKVMVMIAKVNTFRKKIEGKYKIEIERKYNDLIVARNRMMAELKSMSSEDSGYDKLEDDIFLMKKTIQKYDKKDYRNNVGDYIFYEYGRELRYEIIDEFKNKIPNIPKKLLDYWENTTMYDGGEIERVISVAIYNESIRKIYDKLDNPIDFDFNTRSTPFIPWGERVENAFNFKDLPSFIGNNYKVVLDEVDIDYTKWLISFDGSLGSSESGGVEIIAPPISITKISKIVKGMFKYITNNGFITSECGLHCNLSYKGKVMHQDVDLFKLMLFMEEGWVFKNFPDRDRNQWVYSMLKQLDNMFHVVRFSEIQFGEKDNELKKDMKKTPVKKYWDLFRKQLPSNSHYNSISWKSIMSKKASRIEIRWLGGNNYHTKYDEIIEGIGKFAHYLKLSLDPSYKWKDYVKKLWRMFSDKGNADPLQYKKEEKGTKLRSILRRNGKFIGSHKENRETYLYYDYKGFVYKYNVDPKRKDGIPIKYMKLKDFYKKLDKGNFLKGFKI